MIDVVFGIYFLYHKMFAFVFYFVIKGRKTMTEQEQDDDNDDDYQTKELLNFKR